MFAPLSKTQIIGISSNSREIHAYTSLLQHGSTLFAFGSEHLVFIYDRQTFKQTIIDTPDPSSPLVALTFSGYGPDCKLICVNTKSMLYIYSMTNLKDPIYSTQTQHKPISMTATNDLLFYQTEHSIYSHPIILDSDNQIQVQQNTFILTDTNTHQRCLVSPCGRALATYTRGLGYPVIYYSPFKKKRCAILPLQAKISDFQWGTSEHLIAITADDHGSIRLWIESTTSYELHCVKWFHFDSRILSSAICVSTDIESQTTQVKASSKHSDLVFPLIKRHPVLILAILDSQEKNVHLLQETANPHLEDIASISMPLDAAITTLCDLRRIFSNHIIKRLISVTRFSRDSLSFFQFEIGGNSFSTVTPFSLDFIKSPIIKILKYKNPITIHKDGSCYDWLHSRFLNNKYSIIELVEFKNGEISICRNSIHYFYYENEKEKERKFGSYNLNDSFDFASVYKFNNNSNAMIVLCNSKNILVVFFDGLKFIENFVDVNSELIRSVTIHSTDLFAVSTDKSVDTYIFNGDHFEKFASYEVDSPNAIFIPHPFALIAISFQQSINFFVVWRNGFIPINTLDSNLKAGQIIPKLRTITLIDDNVLLAATKSFFVEINIPKSTFPLPYENNSDYVLLSSFSLAIFYPLFERLNGRKLINKSFDIKMNSESFSFPSEVPEDIPPILEKVCQSPPPNWGVLDDEGQRFLFSWILTRNYIDLQDYIPLFGVWALLSRDQSTLISSLQINSLRMFCETLIPIWAKDTNILKKAVSVLVTETIPRDEEVEDYLLLCVLVDQLNVAKRIARIKHKKKLENFLSSPYLDGNIKNKNQLNDEVEDEDFKQKRNDLKKKMEKSAFEAQKKHKFSLSAMFFFLRKMDQQAFIILKKMKMLYIVAARLQNRKDWPLMIQDSFLNDFYRKYWTEKIKKDDENDTNNNNDNFTSITKMAKAKTLSTALFAPKEAIDALKKWDFPKSKIISIELHRYKILKKFDALQPSDILGLQMTPGFLKAQLDFISNGIETAELLDSEVEKIPNSLTTIKTNSKTEDKKTNEKENEKQNQNKNEFEFNFGMDNADFDDFEYEDEYENESESENENKNENETKNENENNNENEIIENKSALSFSITAVVQAESNKRDKILFTSYFSHSFFEPPFKTTSLRIFSYNENFIIYLISCILNNTFNKDTVRRIARIANDLFYSNDSALIVVSIIYALSFAMSRPSIMLPIFQKPMSFDSCHFFIQQLCDGIYSVPNDNAPNILRNIVSQNVEITDNDRLLANFITLHEFCAILSSAYIDLLNNKNIEDQQQKQQEIHQFKNSTSATFVQKSRISLKNDPFNSIIEKTNPYDEPKSENFISKTNTNNNNNNNNNDNDSDNEDIIIDVAEGSGIYDNGNDSCFTFVDLDPLIVKKRNKLANYKVISFFHHLHRLNFDHLPSTSFTNQSFLQDLVALGISCWDLPDEMKASQIDKKWMISLDNPFISPFYFADHFQASKSFEIPTRLDGRVFGICLDRFDPNFVAICNNEKVEIINIASRKSKNSDTSSIDSSSYLLKNEQNIHSVSSFDLYAGSREFIENNSSSTSFNDSTNLYTTMMFDSPFVTDHVFTSGEATKVNKFEFFKKRDFTPLWMTDHTSFKEVNATCMAAHPSLNYFFIGSMTGRVYLASFDVKRNDSLSKKKVTTIKIAPQTNYNSSNSSQANSIPSKSQSVSQLHKNQHHGVQLYSAASPTSTMLPGNSSYGRGTVILNQNPTMSLTSTFTYSMKTNKMTTMNAIRSARAAAAAAQATSSTNTNSLMANLNQHNNMLPIPPSKSLNLSPNSNKNDSSTSVNPPPPPSSSIKNIKSSKVAKSTMNSVCFYDGSVTSIKVNMTGDKILTTCDNGYVFLSDFQNSASLFVCSPRVSACWLNSDTQIIVWDPSNSSLLAYDTNAGLQPVATFKLPQRSYSYCPIDVYGSQVVAGYADGSVVMIDLKNSEIMQSMNVHKSPVSALQFDKSGRFFISGSAENSIKIINAKVEQKPFELLNAFSDYNVFGLSDNDFSNSSSSGQFSNRNPSLNEYPGILGLSATQRGILNVDITDHTLVACGYSSNIRVWMVTDPFSSIV